MPNSLNSKRARTTGTTARSMEKDSETSTKDAILDAAEEEFAEKGIAGARVEQIALRAGVAKALIYYYFEGKLQLLQAIVDRTIEENVSLKRSAIKAGRPDQDPFDVLLAAGMDFMKQKKNVLRIFLMELLKKEDTDIPMLQVLDRMFSGVLASGTFMPGRTLDEMRMPAFFFGSLPFCLFFLMEDKWAEYYKTSKTTLEKQFLESSKTAGSYLRQLMGDGSKK